MTATVEQARDEIYTLFKTAMGANAPSTVVVYDDQKQGTPKSVASWARISVRHTSGGQSTLGKGLQGTGRFTRTGTVYINLFSQPGDGLRSLDPLTKIALDAFEGKTTPSAVWFSKSRVRELGIVNGWYQTNVLIDFSYDELK